MRPSQRIRPGDQPFSKNQTYQHNCFHPVIEHQGKIFTQTPTSLRALLNPLPLYFQGVHYGASLGVLHPKSGDPILISYNRLGGMSVNERRNFAQRPHSCIRRSIWRERGFFYRGRSTNLCESYEELLRSPPRRHSGYCLRTNLRLSCGHSCHSGKTPLRGKPLCQKIRTEGALYIPYRPLEPQKKEVWE